MNSLKSIFLILLTFFICHVNGQNCTLSFDGETDLCAGGNNTYPSSIPASIQSVEWQLDGQVISNDENLSIDWSQYGTGTFNLCLTTTESCNNATVDPFCQMISYQPIEVDSVATLCEGRFIKVFNQYSPQRDTSFSLAGTHTYTYQTDNGCDSIVTYKLTKIPSETIVLPDTSICAGDFYAFGDSMYITSGNKQNYIADEEGCFTNFLRKLEVRDPIETITPVEICIEDAPYEIWDKSFSETGMFQNVFTAADGCDSTAIIDLMIYPLIDTLLFDTLCAEAVYAIGDTSFNLTGTHVYIFEGVGLNACDSIVTIDLIVKEEIINTISLDLCKGEDLPIDQDIVTLDIVPDTDLVGSENVIGKAVSVNGCDSTIFYTITVNPTHYTNIDTMLCYNTSVTIGGNIFFSNTANVIILPNQYGCDSIVDYKVRSTATKPIEFTFKQTLCPETDDLFIGDSLIAETGHYEIALQSHLGCDSIVIADIIAHKAADLTYEYEDILCKGTTYDKVENKFLTVGGTYIFDHIESATTGCDSLIILNLVELKGEKSSKKVEEVICEGDYFVHPDFLQDTLKTENIHPLARIFPETCENFDLEVTILFTDSVHISQSKILCEGDSLLIGNSIYKDAGVFVDTLQRAVPMGCDSIITTTIELRDCNIEIDLLIEPSICSGINTGMILFEVTIGKPPLSYELSLPGSGVIKTGKIDDLLELVQFDSLPGGNYSLVLKDEVNAYREFSMLIDQPNEIKVDWNSSNYNQFNLACKGDEDGTLEVLPTGGTAPYNYIWSNGTTSASLFDLSAGMYTVTISDAKDCEYIESFIMTEPDSIVQIITQDIPSCADIFAGEIIVRSTEGGVAPYSYKLNNSIDFSDKRRYETLGSGAYTLTTIDDNGCISEFETVLPEPIIPDLLFDSDMFVDLGDELKIDLESNVPLVYTEWDGPEGLSCYDCENPSIRPIESKMFMVSVISVDSCATSKELTIHVNKKRDVFVPNIFSPNRDGLNDRLVVYGGPEVMTILNFEVFNRWGSKVYSKTNFAPNMEEGTWDGTYAGELMRPGSFVWMAKISFIDGQVLDFYGDVVIK